LVSSSTCAYDLVGQATIEAAVKELLALKAEYKLAAGKDWLPGATPDAAGAAAAPAAAAPVKVPPTQQPPAASEAAVLNEKIVAQGNAVRDLKAAKADKVADEAQVLPALCTLRAELVFFARAGTVLLCCEDCGENTVVTFV